MMICRRSGGSIGGRRKVRRPPERVITMRDQQGQSARLRRRRVESPTGLARRHWAAEIHPGPRGSSSTFLRPLARGPLRPFLATVDALTPACSVAAVLGLFPAAARSAPREQVSLIHALGLPAIPSPTTCGCSALPGYVTHRQVEPRLLPSGNSRLRHWLAGSSHHTGRIEFVILRTSRSPPAAPHPVSRRRSCSRLQVTLTWRGLSPLRPNALSGALAQGRKPWGKGPSPRLPFDFAPFDFAEGCRQFDVAQCP